jgi:excisionase family DNA binding protein
MNKTEREPRRSHRVKEAAAIMGVPPRTMYHLAETGQIPCRRLGTVILVPGKGLLGPSGWWHSSRSSVGRTRSAGRPTNWPSLPPAGGSTRRGAAASQEWTCSVHELPSHHLSAASRTGSAYHAAGA